ncbi:hypothetical protein CSHISOI_01406 [Colletotrichum shisoi]|uniref:Uncharacterized protein n=1 Tax=Colletotrichum shisoi TaxID=2078593 RepID=A0A5Q4C4X6_9PEZI|nr:hypothetical protein CSHISOI_01406 [Colletotrichum shisoi]
MAHWSNIDIATCDRQLECPLFSVIPGEIRNEIFALALIQYEDDKSAYPEESYWYRPGFRGPRRSSSALLRTCKLAHEEGQTAFLRELEFAFWFDRGPDGRTGNESCERFFNRLTMRQSCQLRRVRLFTQMFWLEQGHNIQRIFMQPRFRPETLTVTVRYSDWWHWEEDKPLRMAEDWLRGFRGPVGLRELRVEYETLARKKDAMMKIVKRNKGWKLAVGKKGTGGVEAEGGYLSAEGTRLGEWRWRGTSKLGGREWAHHGEGDTVEYVVVTDTWRFVEGIMPKEDEARRDERRVLFPLLPHRLYGNGLQPPLFLM